MNKLSFTERKFKYRGCEAGREATFYKSGKYFVMVVVVGLLKVANEVS
jgi:hypothetical protein